MAHLLKLFFGKFLKILTIKSSLKESNKLLKLFLYDTLSFLESIRMSWAGGAGGGGSRNGGGDSLVVTYKYKNKAINWIRLDYTYFDQEDLVHGIFPKMERSCQDLKKWSNELFVSFWLILNWYRLYQSCLGRCEHQNPWQVVLKTVEEHQWLPQVVQWHQWKTKSLLYEVWCWVFLQFN